MEVFWIINLQGENRELQIYYKKYSYNNIKNITNKTCTFISYKSTILHLKTFYVYRTKAEYYISHKRTVRNTTI
jgi:hypothetical protein